MDFGDLPALLTALAAVLAVLKQGRDTRAEVRQVAKQMQPNGGSSFRDAIDRIATDVAELRQELLQDRRRQDSLAVRVDDGLKEHVAFRDQITEALHLHSKCR